MREDQERKKKVGYEVKTIGGDGGGGWRGGQKFNSK